MDDGGTPPVWTAVGNLTSISGISPKVTMVSTTPLDASGGVSTALPGRIDPGQVSLEVHWSNADVQQNIYSALIGRTSRRYRIEWPMANPPAFAEFDGYVTGWNQGSAVGTVLTANVTLQPAGEVETGYAQNWVLSNPDPLASPVNPSNIHRATVPTGLVDGKNWHCVASLYWPSQHSGQVNPNQWRPIVVFADDNPMYAHTQYRAFAFLLGDDEGTYGDQTFKVQTKWGTYSSSNNWNKSVITGFGKAMRMTIGASSNGTTGHMWYGIHGNDPVVSTDSPAPGDNILHLGNHAYTDKWAIAAYGHGVWQYEVLNKAMSDVTWDSTYIDFSVASNIESFYKNGRPQAPSASGNYGHGTPKIFFGREMLAPDWVAGNNKGSGGDFTHEGTLFSDMWISDTQDASRYG